MCKVEDSHRSKTGQCLWHIYSRCLFYQNQSGEYGAVPVQMFILCTSVQNMSRTLLCGTIVALTFFLVFCVVSAEHVPLSFVRLRIIKCGVFEERHYSFVVCVVAYKFYDEMWCFCRTCSFVVCAVAYNKMWCFLQNIFLRRFCGCL